MRHLVVNFTIAFVFKGVLEASDSPQNAEKFAKNGA
jgi:hypothetical protein